MTAVLRLQDVERTYGHPPVRACAGISVEIAAGELVAVVGPSGSGKSTLLNLMGTLDRPTSGRLWLAGHDVGTLSDAQLSALRAHTIGFVFQQFHLAEGSTAVDNVADGLLYRGIPRAERRELARVALETVGLGPRSSHRPHQLSGGERQRVAIARALAGNPPLLLADEPTGNLDSESGRVVVDLLHRINAGGATVVVITHDRELADQLPRRLEIRDGLLVADSARQLEKDGAR